MSWILKNLWLIPVLPLLAAGISALLKRPNRSLAAGLAIGAMGASFLVAVAGFIETLGKHGAAAAAKADGSDSDEDMLESEDDSEDEAEDAKLHVRKIAHTGGINRVRACPQQHGDKMKTDIRVKREREVECAATAKGPSSPTAPKNPAVGMCVCVCVGVCFCGCVCV